MTNKILVKGSWYDETFCKSIESHVCSRIPNMPFNVGPRLKTICGKEFWNTLTRGEKIIAGFFIASLVEENKLPLRFGRFVSGSRTFYRI